MSANATIRKLHYWASIAIALPASVMLATGILLQTKKHWSWVQPHEERGTGTVPAIGLDSILASVAADPDLDVTGWEMVNRIDVRPGKGVAKVWLHSGWEAQVDLGTGRILATAYRRSDLIESIHDGSFFGGNLTKLGLFLPTGVVLFFMWASGLWLFAIPLLANRRRRASQT
ncbi:MAG: PepSY domain-containing protein [Gemmatimonadales bacterium]